MTQKRYNIFNQIHKGLRGMLYDTAMNIQLTDMSKANAVDVIHKLATVIDVFHEHAHNEDKFILPLLKKYNPDMIMDFEKDHEIDEKLSDRLRELCIEWINIKNEEQRAVIGSNMYYSFNEFIAFNLYHMNKEEHSLLLELWKYYTDEELHEVTKNIVASIKPEILMVESRWMIRSLNDSEITEWFTGIYKNTASEVFTKYVNMAQKELSNERFERIFNSEHFIPVNA